jgi:hypothetical protein
MKVSCKKLVFNYTVGKKAINIQCSLSFAHCACVSGHLYACIGMEVSCKKLVFNCTVGTKAINIQCSLSFAQCACVSGHLYACIGMKVSCKELVFNCTIGTKAINIQRSLSFAHCACVSGHLCACIREEIWKNSAVFHIADRHFFSVLKIFFKFRRPGKVVNSTTMRQISIIYFLLYVCLMWGTSKEYCGLQHYLVALAILWVLIIFAPLLWQQTGEFYHIEATLCYFLFAIRLHYKEN